jgi:hypothetical protein
MIDQTATEPTAAPAPAGPVYLADTTRSTTIQLQHPFELYGVQFFEVTVRRLRGFEAKQFAQASLAAVQAGQLEPIFPGVELSTEAYAALDDDDVYAIDQAIEAFLPARFQALSALAEKLGSPAGASSPNGGR